MPNTAEPLERAVEQQLLRERLPRPSVRFRLRAWREFQRALDPLAPPRSLRPFRFMRH